MKIIKSKDYVLLKNSDGEYHLSLDKFNKLGEEEAKKLALREIELKNNSSINTKTINFKQARALGFCEYGIKDFCNQLHLDINSEYKIEELNKLLTLNALEDYPDECIKLFGENTLKYLGGVEGVLSEDTIDLVLRPEFIEEKKLHILSVKFAYSCLDIFEKECPNDNRPRKAIEAKEAWIKGLISEEELEVASSAARSTARSAAWVAARSAAWAAAISAVRSASYAVRSASSARSARSARSAAWAATTRPEQVKMIKQTLKEDCDG